MPATMMKNRLNSRTIVKHGVTSHHYMSGAMKGDAKVIEQLNLNQKRAYRD
tara:strand:+ start:342 stop:494 length:153 start_codon:yes stop_codon:yes gene_type:complete